ncbi:MAG: Nif3-like dinuclear metal center hexameric protein, partial [Planctomycetia bacterium]|nr:Nif3-like dinuclear metal center hexameric protein [Planctomycetia bacterium]
MTTALERIAPLRLAAEWDAVGLLVEPRRPTIERILTCLSVTRGVVAEAVEERADLVITHHPLPFKPVARLIAANPTGRLLLDLAAAGIGVWSSHTAWDSAAGGINDQLAALLELDDVAPLVPDGLDPTVGCGRMGRALKGAAGAGGSPTVGDIASRLIRHLRLPGAFITGAADRAAGRVGIVCGSGGDCLADVLRAGCTTFVTGEIRLHDALAAAHRDAPSGPASGEAGRVLEQAGSTKRLREIVFCPNLHLLDKRNPARDLEQRL